MSASGFRGRGFGPRGARTKGPSNGFSGPRFPHPTFNHARPPLHRLSGSEKWTDSPNFPPWQQNKNFIPRPQFRGKLPFRPNGRGRAANGRGIVRFSGPGRPPGPQFCMGFARNSAPRVPVPLEEQIVVEEDKSVQLPQTPLLGSEEERQQKITETADKLKQKLSSITEEDLTNFWEDDLSFLPNSNSEDGIALKKGIPELRHGPPELDLTFTDFRDIGRVGCNNSKFDNADDDIIIAFESGDVNKITTENNDTTIINENQGDPLNISELVHSNDNLNQLSVLLEDDGCQEQMFHELSTADCNLESLHLQCDSVSEDLQSSNTGTDANLTLDENVRMVALIQPVNDLPNENPLVFNDIETVPEAILNDQDAFPADCLENQSTIQDAFKDIVATQDTCVDTNGDDHSKTNANQQDNVHTNVSQEEACQTLANTPDSTQTNSATPPPSNEETPVNSICDSKSPTCSPYEEVQKLCNSPAFQPRLFNIPPRFAPRIPPGPRCRWTFQPNGKNVFFRGPQRIPFHGNRMPPPRHIAPYKPPDMGPVTYGPCAPPPFTHNVPVSSHDSQHHTLVPFSSSDLPPAFDPSEPPPNIRSISVTESSNRQEIAQSRSPLDSRNQVTSVPPSNMDIMHPPPSFDPRGPPPEFNPQQPPPKIHKPDKLLQPPPIFDPWLSSQERSKLIAPRNPAGSHIMANFLQPLPFMPNLPVNFQPVLPQTNNGQAMVQDFVLPLPPMNIADVPPPPSQQASLEKNFVNQPGLSMDDGLEDMQEAMEFAKQIMNMTEKMKGNQGTSSVLSEAQCTQSEIPVPKEDVSCTSSATQSFVNSGKKWKKIKSKTKKGKQATSCETKQAEKPEETETLDEKQCVENKSTEDAPLACDQIRPKVIFNLSSKTKVLQKQEEWHRPANISDTREVPQSVTTQISQKERRPSKRYTSEPKRNNQIKTHQKKHSSKVNLIQCADIAKTPIPEKSNDSYNKDHNRDSEKPNAQSLAVTIPNNISAQKSQKSKKENRKSEAPTSESSWKNRVISRFLKMSKNDICNMVNNSSLRKFDIAMKHLVKERRSSLSLKMRNTEDEKMKEYDREEFMNQLNAMLDPSAVVGITDLPTEFIHHLSEVLQLDPMPSELELSEQQKTNVDEVKTANENDNPRIYSSECFDEEESIDVQPLDYQEQHVDSYLEQAEDNEPLHCSLNTELAGNLSREDTSSSKKLLLNKSNPEVETLYKRQQPLFNEADLDDILYQVTERARSLPNVTSRIYTEVPKVPFQPVAETFEHNTFAQISNATAADLDDIFSAGIARAKLLSKTSELDISRARKSSSEDRNTFRSERYERRSRKEREDPDSFRNLTKEEWEAKYGTMKVSAASDNMWRDTFSSAENLSRISKSNRRHCSSDSPMRNLSISPWAHELSAHNQERYEDRYSEIEEPRTLERSESSNDQSTSSSSETDEETVSHNVTKLLKVIKENEKIAKKRTLNETIRDEVTAEIEKKRKEKSRYKERKLQKRENRKNDRREKRKRDKKRKRKRNSHSNTSRSSEYSEEYRLLTEEEIKKEVIVKEEPLSTFEDSISEELNSEYNNSHVEPAAGNKTVEASFWVESQCSQAEKQQIPTIACDKVSLQPKKPTIISMTMQPKTKAQLKQMPSPIQSEQNQIVEKPAETERTVSTSSYTSSNSEKTNKNMEEAIASEVTEANNERAETPPCTNDAVPQVSAPLNIVEQSCTEAVSNVNTANVPGNCTHPVAETHTANQPTEQKAPSTGSNETRSGYKKIDIKVYKERALQRRLQEEAKLKEKCGSPVPASQESSQPALPTNKVESETDEAEKEAKSIEAGNNVPLKDPRLTKARSSQSVSPSCVPSQKEVSEKANFEEDHQYIDIFQKNKELFASAQPKNESPKTRVKIKSITRLNSKMNIVKDPLQAKNCKNDDKPSSQERAKRESDNLKAKVGFKGESDEKKSKKLTTAERNKFKNIRSEGSKELKLKKEKKLTKKKSATSKSSTKEKDSKHPQKAEELQKSMTVNANNAVQAEAEKINSSDTSESLQSRESTTSVENLTQESSSTFAVNKEEVSTDFTMEQGNDNILDNNEDVVDVVNPTDPVSKEIMQQVPVEHVDEEGKEVENSSLISEIEQSSEKTSEANAIQCESNEELERADVVEEAAAIAENVSSAEYRHDQQSQPWDENKCLNNEDDLKNAENNSENLETEAKDDSRDESEPIIQAVEDVRPLESRVQSEADELKSPDSSGSPFKGFFLESIEDDTPQESALCEAQIMIRDEKESVTQNCTEWMEAGTEDQPNEKDDNFETVEEAKDSNGVMSTRSSIEEPPGTVNINIVSETVSDHLNVVDSVTDDTKNLRSEDEVTLKGPETDVIDTQHTNFSPIHDLVSRDAFDEDGEPFIVLDEYIDDTEGRSLEKLNNFDIDLEECIARDTDTFVSAPKQGEQDPNLIQIFDSIHFKELSVDLDENNERSAEAKKKIEINLNVTTSESNEKDSVVTDVSSGLSESSEKSKLEVPIDIEDLTCSQKDATNADDIPRQSPIRELACVEEEKTEHNSESPTSSKESGKLSVPARSVSATKEISSEGDVEPPEFNKKQTGGKTVSISSDAAEIFVNRDVQLEQEKQQQEVRETFQMRDTNKTNQEEENKVLHKVKDKPKMKSKQPKKRNVSKNQIKKAVAADTVKPVYPSTKEAIMARMIEIDVEIHKLMTEKMTLYQKLTSDALPTDSDFEQNDTVHEHKDTETSLITPRTPSALMSQLIQNIETKPVANQCAKTTVETVLLKDSTVSSVRLGKSKTSRCEQHSEKKANNVSTCSSENEEAVHRTGDIKSPPSKRRRKQKGSERAVKWDNNPECIKDTPHVDVEDRQTSNAIKPILKKVGASEVKPREDCDDASADKLCTPDVEESEKAVEQTESRDAAEEFDKTKSTEQANNNRLVNDADAPSSILKMQENRTPERSSIYSDDSTWDSLVQAASDDQRKPATGLALLEETYKKEMAKTRMIKAETRKKKKKETRGLSQVPLSPEEEELPLFTLYTNKLHAMKKLNSVDEEEEKGSDDQQVWKNVVEVINAVAENRLEDLYTGTPVEQLGKNSQINVPDTDDTSTSKEQASDRKPSPEPKQLAEETKEIVVSVPLTSIKDTCTQHSRTSSDDKVDMYNNEQLTPSLNKIQPNSEEQADRNFIDTETRAIAFETPTSIEGDMEPVQQTAKNLEISQVASVEPGANDVNDNQAILNTSEANVNTENTEETNAEKNGKEEAVDIDRTMSVNPEETIAISDASNRNEDDTNEANDGIFMTRTVAHYPNKNSSYEPEHANEESSKDSSANQETRCEKEDGVDDPEGSSDHFISLKDHKALKKRRESERSNKSSSEENNNRNRTPVPVFVDTAEACKSDEASSKKPKRKRGSSRTPLRRSSRYTEEVTKRMKLEIDGIQSSEQESLEKNIHIQFPSVSPTSSSYDDDTESISSNGKRSRSQKTNVNRKRSTQSELEVLSSSTSPTNEDFKDIKRCKHTMPEMMNCKVRLVDSKHTILKPNVDPNVLRKYGISTINSLAQSAPEYLDQPCSIPELMSKDSRQGSKLIKKADDATRFINHLVSLDKADRGPKSMKANLFAYDKEVTATSLADDPKVEVASKEQVLVNVSQENRDKPNIEIVEEKAIVTKNQHQNDSGSMLTVIETKDDKEILRTQYTVHKGPILDIKVFENSFLAASEDGRIYRYSQASNGILNIYKGHKAAVTCLYVYNPNSTDVNKEWMFSGSLDGTLRCYNITTGVQLRDTADIGSPIQCMDEAWGIIFIGTKSGHVSRYHIKSGVIKGNSIQFSDKSVLALKATNEGPRRVLIVASRSQPITIRDAQNGLFLRTICGQKSHTVYSLMRDHNLIYCGTSTTSILVFDFTNGEQITQYDAGVGIVCMRLYKQLLFAGCYDGNIYIFDTKDHRLVCSIPGPGNMLLSMEVIDNKIIAGSKDKRLQSWQMSRHVRALL